MLAYALQRADRLSGGQQQRVAIARTLAQQSRYALADEPVASLDPETAKSVLSILREIARERLIAILVSLHQVELAVQFADRIIGLRGGRMIADRRTAEFTETDHRMIFAT
jgi:phosphonate transport system ATP-binding protein